MGKHPHGIGCLVEDVAPDRRGAHVQCCDVVPVHFSQDELHLNQLIKTNTTRGRMVRLRGGRDTRGAFNEATCRTLFRQQNSEHGSSRPRQGSLPFTLKFPPPSIGTRLQATRLLSTETRTAMIVKHLRIWMRSFPPRMRSGVARGRPIQYRVAQFARYLTVSFFYLIKKEIYASAKFKHSYIFSSLVCIKYYY